MVVAGTGTLATAVAQGTSVGLVVVDGDRLVWLNPAADALARRHGADWAGTGGDELRRLVRHVPVGAQSHELCWTPPDGAARWLQISCRALPADTLTALPAQPGPDRTRTAVDPAPTGPAPTESESTDPYPGHDPRGGATAGDGLPHRSRSVPATRLYEIVDVTERHEELARARNREWRLSRLEALARMGTWEWDIPNNQVVWSDELLRMFGYPKGTDLSYEQYRSLLYPDDVKLIEDTLAEALQSAQPFSYTHRMYLADRVTLRIFQCYGEVFTDATGRPVRILGTAHDITAQRRAEEELAYLAGHDPLTGLANRRTVSNFLQQCADAGGEVALLLIDVDNFKDINDLRGHAIGDQVMRSLARSLTACLEEQALLGRLGGDEFAVVLPDRDPDKALAVAERLCDVVARTPIVAHGTPVKVTASIGVAQLGPERDCDVALAHADLALYEAKNAGRNRARLFSPEQYDHAVHRVSVIERIGDALDHGMMQLDAQPIVDLASRRVNGYELLIRMRDGREPAIGPDQFLPAAERSDLVLRIDRWVLTQAVQALATPRARERGLRLEVNMSCRSLEDASLGEWILEQLRAAEVEPHRLGLEITETTAIASLDAARRLAGQLTRAGCRFTLDDFGAGFGSFSYLKHLPFTGVKIAGEFVRRVDQSNVDSVLVQAIVQVAQSLGMSTIAEYVDRDPLIGVLRNLGVDQGQGYHLGMPEPLVGLLAAP